MLWGELRSWFLLLITTRGLSRALNGLLISDWFVRNALAFLLVPFSNSKAANDLLDLQPAFQQPLPVSATNTWGGEIPASLGISSAHVLIHTLLSHSAQSTCSAWVEFMFNSFNYTLLLNRIKEKQYAHMHLLNSHEFPLYFGFLKTTIGKLVWPAGRPGQFQYLLMMNFMALYYLAARSRSLNMPLQSLYDLMIELMVISQTCKWNNAICTSYRHQIRWLLNLSWKQSGRSFSSLISKNSLKSGHF